MMWRHSFSAIALVLTLGACAHVRGEPEPIPADQSSFRVAKAQTDEPGLPEEFHAAAIGDDALRGALQAE